MNSGRQLGKRKSFLLNSLEQALQQEGAIRVEEKDQMARAVVRWKIATLLDSMNILVQLISVVNENTFGSIDRPRDSGNSEGTRREGN